MSDVLNRDALERKLARVVSREHRSQLDQLLALLGDPPLLENVPPEFWDNGGKGLRKVVMPVFLETYLQQAEQLMREVNIGVDWALVNEGAVEWAKNYSYELVTGITETTRKGVSKAVSTYFEAGLDLRDLEQSLLQYYGPKRATMIAVTETTRATVQGGMSVVNLIELDNPSIRMVPYWITSRDYSVCPLCEERDGKEITDGVYPPLHPNCNCDVRWEMTVDDGTP